MADNARHEMFLVEETGAYAELPATPAFSTLLINGCSLGLTKSSSVSKRIRGDRQIADFRHGTKQVGGDIDFELSYSDFDQMLEAVMCGNWTPRALITDDTISAAASDDSYNDSGNGFVLAGFQVGEIIDVSGFATGANNGRRKILTLAAGKITVANADGTAIALTDEAAGPSVEITAEAEVLKAGVERRSFSALRHFADLADGPTNKPWHLYSGIMLNTLSLTLSPDEKVNGKFGAIGQDLTLLEEMPAGSTFSTPSTNRVFDAFTGSLSEGGSPLGDVTEMTLTLENGVAPKFVLFSDVTREPNMGDSNFTGSIGLYFQSAAMYEKFINEELSDIQFTMTDLHGNSYIFDIPSLSYTGGQPDVAGSGGSVMLTMPFQAIYDATTDTNVQITRVPKV